MFKKNKGHFLFLLIIVIFGLIPLLYFRNGSIIFGGDEGGWMLSPLYHLKNLSLWRQGDGTGWPDPLATLDLGYLLPLSFFEIVGINTSFSQAILMSFSFMGSGLAMYLLCNVLFKNACLVKVIAFAAAIFYMFNSYNMAWNWSSPNFQLLSSYILYPLLLTFFIKGLDNNNFLKSSITFSLITVILPYGYGNPSFSIIFFMSILFYSFYYLFFSKREVIARCLKFISLCLFFSLLLNLYWILPSLSFLNEGLDELSLTKNNWVEGISTYSSLLRLLQLRGHSFWFSDFTSKPILAYAPFMNSNFIFIIIGFLPIIYFLQSLIFSNKMENRTRKVFLFFGFLFIISIFFAKGTHSPFGNVNNFFYQYFSIFSIFRSPFPKFGLPMALCLSIFFGLCLSNIYIFFNYKIFQKISSNKYTLGLLLYLIGIFLIILGGYPFLNGDVIHSGKGFFPSFYHKIPSEYYKIAEWLNNQKDDFNLYSASVGRGAYENYKLSNNDIYRGVDFDNMLINKPIIHSHLLADSDDFRNSLYTAFINKKIPHMAKILLLFNSKYILFHKDYLVEDSPNNNVLFQEATNLSENIVLEKEFDRFQFYRNYLWQPSHFYVTEKQTLIFDKNDKNLDFIDSLFLNNYKLRPAFIIKSQNNKIENVNLIEDSDRIIIFPNLSKDTKNGNSEINTEKTYSLKELPFVNNKPGTLGYYFALIEEKIQLQRFNNQPERLIESYFLFASKRISEIKKYTDSLNQGKKAETLDKYIGEINTVIGKINELKLLDSQKYLSLFLTLHDLTIFHRSELASVNLDEKIKNKLNSLFDYVEEQSAHLVPKEEISNMSYQFNIYQSGEYEIYLNSIGLNKLSLNKINFFIDGQKININPKELDGQNFQIINKTFFIKGDHQVNIVLANESLSASNNWRVYETSSSKQVIYQDIKDYYPNGNFKISFDYMNNNDNTTLFLTENNQPIPLINIDLPKTDNENFVHQELTFKSGESASTARVFLSTKSQKREIKKVIIDKLEIKKTFEPTIFLCNSCDKNLEEDIQSPKITYTKINFTKYRIKIENAKKPFFLIFSESFHPYWRVYILNKNRTSKNSIFDTLGKNSLSESQHYLVNGFANSWYITPKNSSGAENYEIIVEFWPQRFLYFGLLVLFITIPILLLILFFKKWKNN